MPFSDILDVILQKVDIFLLWNTESFTCGRYPNHLTMLTALWPKCQAGFRAVKWAVKFMLVHSIGAFQALFYGKSSQDI